MPFIWGYLRYLNHIKLCYMDTEDTLIRKTTKLELQLTIICSKPRSQKFHGGACLPTTAMVDPGVQKHPPQTLRFFPFSEPKHCLSCLFVVASFPPTHQPVKHHCGVEMNIVSQLTVADYWIWSLFHPEKWWGFAAGISYSERTHEKLTFLKIGRHEWAAWRRRSWREGWEATPQGRLGPIQHVPPFDLWTCQKVCSSAPKNWTLANFAHKKPKTLQRHLNFFHAERWNSSNDLQPASYLLKKRVSKARYY